MGRTLICYTHITPRLVRRLECLAACVEDLAILEIAASEAAYPWWNERFSVKGVRQHCLFDRSLAEIGNAEAVAALESYLRETKPEVAIVADYSRPYMRFICRWVKRQGGRTVLPAVTWAGDHRRWRWREFLKGLLVRRLFDAVCAGGERSSAYFRSLGFGPGQLWKAANVIDNAHFAAGAAEARAHSIQLRKQQCLPNRHFLFVGAFEKWKNLSGLVDAYVRYRQRGGAWGLVAVGNGSERDALAQRIERERIPQVELPGMKDYGQIPSFYGRADCLIVPSLSEPWGLVVNEAEAAGLPVLASHQCGCVPELVHRGINGDIFDPRSPGELCDQMLRISSNEPALLRMGESSRELIRYYTPERWAAAMADCVVTLRSRTGWKYPRR